MMNKGLVFGLPVLAVALAMMPRAQAGSAAVQGARQDDTVMSSSGGAAWIDCDRRNQQGNPKCAKERERANRADTSSARAAAGSSDKSTSVPLAGPEGKGVVRGGS
jgi:hypothetical protein